MTLEPYAAACPVDACSFVADSTDAGYELAEHLEARHNVDRGDAYDLGSSLDRREYLREQSSRLEREAGSIARAWTLDTFPAIDEAGRVALDVARRFVAGEFRPSRLYVDGPPGTGKTGLAVGISRAWIVDDPSGGENGVEFANVRRLLAEQRRRFSAGLGDDLERFLDPNRSPLVVLDDLGAERPTDYALDVVATLVESLHVAEAPLVVTTNYSPARLAERLGHADAATGQRIVSRLVDGATRIRLERDDLRRPRRPLDDPPPRGSPADDPLELERDDDPPRRSTALRMIDGGRAS